MTPRDTVPVLAPFRGTRRRHLDLALRAGAVCPGSRSDPAPPLTRPTPGALP